jgi:hypothetical protein
LRPEKTHETCRRKCSRIFRDDRKATEDIIHGSKQRGYKSKLPRKVNFEVWALAGDEIS